MALNVSLDLISLETLQSLAHDYGYSAVFTGILLENMGIPLPGETVTLVGGFLAGSGELKYEYVLGSAITGAVLGDNLGYWLGRWQGWSFLRLVGRLFRLPESQLWEVKHQFSQNAARAVFLGRFIALLRIFAGPLAGIAEMPYPQFLLCNLAGAAAWATVMVSLSFFVGKLVPLATLITWVSRMGLLALGVFALWLVVPLWWERRKPKIQSVHPSD
ncbi:DedA family protein [Trichothermofontia sp.]